MEVGVNKYKIVQTHKLKYTNRLTLRFAVYKSITMASNNHYLRSEMDNYHADLEVSVRTRSKSPESVHNSQHNKQRLQK